MAAVRPDQASADSGGSGGIEDLFAALESPLLKYALRLTRDLELAEDIVQESFLKLHAQFAEVREPRPWLYRTVHNLALNHRRASARIVSLSAAAPRSSPESLPSLESDLTDDSPLPDEQIARLEGIGLVRLSIEALDPRSRDLVRLKFNDELSYKQISERTGLTVGNVGYLLHHALKAIAAELAKTGVVS